VVICLLVGLAAKSCFIMKKATCKMLHRVQTWTAWGGGGGGVIYSIFVVEMGRFVYLGLI
jgi:hypothetical protein